MLTRPPPQALDRREPRRGHFERLSNRRPCRCFQSSRPSSASRSPLFPSLSQRSQPATARRGLSEFFEA